MEIYPDPSGDFKVVSELPLSIFDLQQVSDKIYWNHQKFVRDWPVLTDDAEDVDRWVYWFLSPVVDDSYLDHEVLP